MSTFFDISKTIIQQGASSFLCPHLPGRVAQSVTCLTTDAWLTADSGGREFDPGPVLYFRGD